MLDQHTVAARLGGAEFAILRRGPNIDANTEDFVAMMSRSVAQPILAGGDVLVMEPCVGTAVFRSGDLPDLSAEGVSTEIMKRAAIALSAASRAGPGTHRLYDDELDHRTQHRLMLRHSLREAIRQDQFEVHYQPIVDLDSGQIVSAEALVRWQHPELGLLRPDLFISLAEESGLIGQLGEWVMRHVMLQVKAWHSEGRSPPKIALNVSGVQLLVPDYCDSVRAVLGETGADAGRFVLEITESVLLDRSPKILSVLAELKAMGFELAIDDFGTGHASFQYLRDFPVDKLKIDQVFVRQLIIGSSDAIIVRAITSMAHDLNLRIVAEGIETAEQRDFLRDQGCSTGQGYFFSLPLGAEDFAWMMEHRIVLPVTRPATGQQPALELST